MKINIKDEWQTPDDLYKWLDSIYHFKYDLCANKDNIKVGTVEDIFKRNTIDGNAFMNPPFSNIGPFIEKAWELSQLATVVCLVPSSIKHNKYMDFLDTGVQKKIIVDLDTGKKYTLKCTSIILDGELQDTYSRQWVDGIEWLDLNTRTHFTHPTLTVSTPAFGCSILILNRSK